MDGRVGEDGGEVRSRERRRGPRVSHRRGSDQPAKAQEAPPDRRARSGAWQMWGQGDIQSFQGEPSAVSGLCGRRADGLRGGGYVADGGLASAASVASAAHAPQLFAGLHEATSLRWRAWRFRIRSGAACGATSPDCERCWTGRYCRAFTASGRLPIASVKRSIFAMAAAGGSARAAARRWPTSRRQGHVSLPRGRPSRGGVWRPRVLPHPVAPAAEVPGTVGEVRDLALVRVETDEQRRVGWRPTSSAGSGTR